MRKLSPMVVLVCAVLVAALSAKGLPPPGGGSGWSVLPSPNASDFSNDLADVSCPSSSFCMAVGGYWDAEPADGGVNRTLIEGNQ